MVIVDMNDIIHIVMNVNQQFSFINRNAIIGMINERIEIMKTRRVTVLINIIIGKPIVLLSNISLAKWHEMETKIPTNIAE